MSRQNTKVSHGVPQGSVLELILFPFYSHGQRFIHTQHGHKSQGNFRLFVIFFNCSFWVEVLYIFAYTFNKFKNKNWEHMFGYILDFFSSSTQGQN